MNFDDLNEKQKEAVAHIEGPLLIVAGAGSGKTKTLTSRLIHLINQGIPPKNIIAITFTNKAAEEMKSRTKALLDEGNKDAFDEMFIGTFHSLGARILREEAHLFGRTQRYTIYDDDDGKSLIKKILKNHNFSEKDKSKMTPVALSKQFSKIKDELLELDDSPVDNQIEVLFKEYENELQKNNAFDFDDLIEKPVRLFLKYPEILEKYYERFKYILVDEYQDTNTVQYYFIKLLAKKHQNLSVVGDDQQSIFKFRGSDFRNFLNFEQDWPKAKVVLLEENYRSTQNIIEAASAVISHNKQQKSKKLFTNNEVGERVKIVEHYSAEREANWITQRIASEIVFGNYASLAVLYRTNAQSRAIEQALIERGIPYQMYGGLKFYERKEIKDIVAALRYGLNPQDEVSLERLHKTFLKKTYLELKEGIPNAAKVMKPLEFIGYVLKTSDYFSYLAKNYDNVVERTENVKELVDFVSNFEDLEVLMEKISLFQSTDMMGRGGRKKQFDKGVRLSTIHLAKGLEFDAVFVAGVNEGLLPHQMSYSTTEEIEEERRLMYVAMTRARKILFLNFYHIPSRFLSEIPGNLTEFEGGRGLDFDDEERYIELD